MAWTETKRRSVQRYNCPGCGPLPVADGTISVGDRAHVAHLFSADSYPAPAAPTVVAQPIARHQHRFMGRSGMSTYRVALGILFGWVRHA